MDTDNTSTFISTPLAIVLGSFVIAIAILISGGVIQLQGVKTLGAKASPLSQVGASPLPQVEEPAGPVEVSLDDDPIIGDKNAPITMIEFSDYECPFCKRYFDQTFSDIKKDYVDTGKLKIVFRDLPLSFHDPMATTEAIAANCAREQGGDSKYFQFHDEVFKRTTSNGDGLNREKIDKIAADVGLNAVNFKTCLDSEKYRDEVEKDLADASLVGADGTPTFFIGKSEEGNKIVGTKLVGAQPYSAFKTILDGIK